MSWLINGLGNIAGSVFSVFLKIIGYGVDLVLRAVVNHVVLPLLNHTVFAPFTLSPGTAVGSAALTVWETAGAVSAAVALLMVMMGVFSRLALSWSGQKSWAEIGEGIAVWMAVIVAGWGFLNLLLGISNDATQALVHSMHQVVTISLGQDTAVGLTGAVASVFTYFLWPVSGMVIAALLIWVVGVWLMRQVDLVLYAGLLPLMAALGIGGNKTPFKWAWSEAMGAVFNQLAMAVVLWIGFLFLKGASPHPTILQEFKDLLLAGTTFTLAARAPQLLANLTGHQSAGAGHLLAGMALGYLGGRGLETAVKGTPLGQGIGKAMQGREAHASAQVTSWAGRKSLGERFKESSMGQAVSGRLAAAGSAISQSGVGRAVSRVAGEGTPLGNVASVMGRGAKAAAKPLQTAASFAYQPMTTLGRMAAGGVADSSPEGPAGTFAQSQAATVMAAEHGFGHAAHELFGRNEPTPTPGTEMYAQARQVGKLGDLMNANVTQGFTRNDTGEAVWQPVSTVAKAETDPTVLRGLTPMADAAGQSQYRAQFASGSWQGALYDKTQNSVLKNIPVTAASSVYASTPPRDSSGSAARASYS